MDEGVVGERFRKIQIYEVKLLNFIFYSGGYILYNSDEL